MAVKTTLRLPDALSKRLHELSIAEKRSFNDTAVRALQAGIGEPVQDEWWRVYGDLVAIPPKPGKFDIEEWKRDRQAVGIRFSREHVRAFMEEFERDRDDRG
ncbi:MAG: hypothetical protein ACR2MY_14750 [Candidatus Dormibacteria bacterium]